MDLTFPKSSIVADEALQGEYATHWYHAIKDELDNHHSIDSTSW
jgi:hypothetical protein